LPLSSYLLIASAYFICMFVLNIQGKGTILEIDPGYKKPQKMITEGSIILNAAGLLGTIFLALILKNMAILFFAVPVTIYWTKIFLKEKKQAARFTEIQKLNDAFRSVISRIPDQQNITKAIEIVRNENKEDIVGSIFTEYLSECAIGGSVKAALVNMKTKIGLKKFDIFIEYLIQANSDGFTRNAMRAMEKALELIDLDMLAVIKVKEKSKKKKKQIRTTLAMIWLFPIILSYADYGKQNLYLDTIGGKILMLAYYLCSVFILIKTEEYLNVRLDEL